MGRNFMSNSIPKPCPFCGAPVDFENGRLWGCNTKGCYASEGTGVDYDEPEDELAAWNRRGITDELISALERCVAYIAFDEAAHGRTFGCAVDARAVLAKCGEPK
jgi:hypothetical protein